MAAPSDLVTARINSIPEYVEAFQKAYGKGVKITFEKIADTIGVFERTLVTPSRFDKFLEGDKNALTKAEKQGLKTFIEKGCASCHNDVALGGTMQPFPVVMPYKHAALGDFKGDENGMVKVPTLRNVTETYPYFHNGAVWKLEEAVGIMGETQLGMELTGKEIGEIVAFLGSLEGKKPTIIYPDLPASTATTPRPDAN